MDESKKQQLDAFGKDLMTHVRDDALLYLTRVISGQMADATSKELSSQCERLDERQAELLGRLLVAAVDAGIVRFLHFIDEYGLQLLYPNASGEKVNVEALSDGLAGELYTEDGWIARYSSFGNALRAEK